LQEAWETGGRGGKGCKEAAATTKHEKRDFDFSLSPHVVLKA